MSSPKSNYLMLRGLSGGVLPGKLLRVSHEDVLDDLENQTRRMLAYSAGHSRKRAHNFKLKFGVTKTDLRGGRGKD